MEFLSTVFGTYWHRLLNVPLNLIAYVLDVDLVSGWRPTGVKLVISALLVFIAYGLFRWFSNLVYRRFRWGDAVVMPQTAATRVVAGSTEGEDASPIRYSHDDIPFLKKQRQWTPLGDAYASLNLHKEAAQAYRKGGEYNQAAIQLVKAGKPVAAARLFEKAGNYDMAARHFAENRRFRRAVRAYRRAGNLPEVGACYARWGKPVLAADTFLIYFKSAQDSLESQVSAVERCLLPLLEHKDARAAVGEEKWKALSLEAARRFDAGKQEEAAAQFYMQAGDPGRAGDLYLRLGRLELAVRCLREAGRGKEASAAGGRFYESEGQWKEAAAAYEGGGVFLRAGDCYSKANDPLRAAQCYERGGEFFGAGFALTHARQWDKAITMLQRVKEDAPRYNESRALLGRCFYEMHDYSQCAAALDNHLTGMRVTSATIEYFWMLALAYEQMGELDKSRLVLQKIRSVDVAYRDIQQRLSSVESRISMIGSQVVPQTAVTPPPAADQATAVMQMVEGATGKRYALERELGRGGMGVVYLARDTQLDRQVALKFLGSMMDDSEEFRLRFVREARAAAKVSHPNIVSIYDIGDQEGSTYIAMEYVAGMNLTRYMSEKGRLPLREALNIALQVCSALDAIHQQAIVHRDIKPDNILIGKGGLVKLMDFGLAKLEDARLTAPGVVMGTPAYMAPEQMRGDETDARADIYALGLVFYELFTGQKAFNSGNILNQQLYEMPPTLRTVDPDIPEKLDRVVMRCIAKVPDERFASTTELIAVLRDARQ